MTTHSVRRFPGRITRVKRGSKTTILTIRIPSVFEIVEELRYSPSLILEIPQKVTRVRFTGTTDTPRVDEGEPTPPGTLEGELPGLGRPDGPGGFTPDASAC